MIETMSIRNFRCFSSLSLQHFKRFNIIVGESGSGKTALLEALFLLASASPTQWLKIRQWRGMGSTIRFTGTRSSYESIFSDLFHNFNRNRGADISLVDNTLGPRSLNISYPGRESLKLPAGAQIDNAFLVDPITFNWHLKGKSFKTRVTVSPKDGALTIDAGREVYPVFFYAPNVPEGTLMGHLFSDLSRKNMEGPLVKAVQSIFPDVSSMSLQSIAGELTICVSLNSLPEKIPVGDVSGGLAKFVSLMTCIFSLSGGVLLIDEFENSFYYSRLSGLIEAICSSCEQQNVQLFASTHSYEFLKAMLPSMEARRDTQNEIVLLRSQRLGSECKITMVGDPSAAIESDFEVR